MAHAIGAFNFSYWQGDPPALPIQHVARYTRPGVDGVGMQTAGTWGDPFEAVLTAHWASYQLALAAKANYNALVGIGTIPIMYNFVEYLPVFGMVATVDYYQTVEVQAGRFSGPGFVFPLGGRIVGRFTMTLHPFIPPEE